jgi:hypothetical protein
MQRLECSHSLRVHNSASLLSCHTTVGTQKLRSVLLLLLLLLLALHAALCTLVIATVL